MDAFVLGDKPRTKAFLFVRKKGDGMIKIISLFGIFVGLFFAENALALRCGQELVKIGDYKTEVLDKCGSPESIETHTEYASQSYGARLHSKHLSSGQRRQYVEEIKVEEWIYNFGRTRLKQYLRFENGRLTFIESLHRGD